MLISSGRRWALMHELRDEPEATLGFLLGRLSSVDIVVVEGFKRERHRKIEVHRLANGKPPLFPDDPAIVAVATDAPALDGAPRLLSISMTWRRSRRRSRTSPSRWTRRSPLSRRDPRS